VHTAQSLYNCITRMGFGARAISYKLGIGPHAIRAMPRLVCSANCSHRNRLVFKDSFTSPIVNTNSFRSERLISMSEGVSAST
jgi:hypothetical protein